MLTSRQEHPIRRAASRAGAAADSVQSRFGHRLFGLPGTHLGAVHNPRERIGSPWHYWWQAHYLDALIDAALRESDERESRRLAMTARRLLRGIHLRNGLRWTNSYYDDMAWLALATDRLTLLGLGGSRAIPPLERALRSAHTPEAGGGLYWNMGRDFKNTPATAPAALLFARRGDPAQAQQLLDWLRQRLRNSHTGLLQDGIRLDKGRETLVPDVYTYNQGPILGALLEMGGPRHLVDAASLITAVDEHLARDGVLTTHGSGDGGLFTGILARYLALAALTPALPATVQRTAATLVTTTAEALWAGRIEAPPAGRGGRRRSHRTGQLAFAAGTGDDALTDGAELSTQLQAWMILEAAYRVDTGAIGDDAEPSE
ncbi:glycoside hydrolase family 76 protein [Arthrobacter sp. H20]|uniref:glycoside hydrolase family 76 protein n=1 Tax=Arthrobacter sp. H20 TaxID=1267981 RepID=UPI000687B8FD|nr:glycoside hydrolase family 76 protein [Arthrobacter sp. H20]